MRASLVAVLVAFSGVCAAFLQPFSIWTPRHTRTHRTWAAADDGVDSEAEVPDRVFDRLLDFPCDFQVKVIGMKQGEFAADMIDTVSRITGITSESIEFKTRDTANDKYQSVTIFTKVTSADMLYQVYEDLGKDPRVKFRF